MRRALPACLLLVTASALGAAPAPRPGGARSDAVEVEALERELVRAIGAKDLATYDRIVADDYVVITPAAPETTKAQVMAQYRSGERGYTDLAIDEVSVHVFGATAVVSARTSGSKQKGGRSQPNRVRYLRVYAKRDGAWRAVAQMSTPAP